ncbi:partial adenylate cyclase, partial [Methylococcales bacterium]
MTSHDNLRMLAAIMFTDIVGYTRMMGDDEEHARQVRDRYRSTLQNAITAGTGRILQYYGDGTLSIFGSAIDAVHAAIEIQRAFRIKPHLPVRIGIHLGDIVYEDDAIFGNGVNVTSRIQALAAPGSILVSDKIADELKNQPGLDTLSYGKVELKNVDRPIELFAIVSDGIVLPKKDQIYSKLPVSYKSIAVLPFVNLSTDPENEYFSDGITEEILNSLTRVEGLQVTSRTSSFMFKNRNEDAREIGALLNVSTLLEGSVRKYGNSIRVTAQLIDTVTGFHLWSENFDRELKDVFALQDEIADTIAEKLTHKLSSPRLEPRNTPRYAENFEAYSAYLKALFYWNKWSPDYINRAIPLLEEAIRLEPMFPPAYSLLGSCYVWLGAMGYLEVGLASSEAKYYILQALNQDEHAI